jgi:hypothetical protein
MLRAGGEVGFELLIELEAASEAGWLFQEYVCANG